MSRPININSQGEEIDLKARRYRIYILGGFGVKLGDFKITLKDKESGELIRCKKAFWPVQAYSNGKKAKRIFIADVKIAGNFEVLFSNPKSVKVKPLNVPFFSLLSRPVSTDKLEIIFSENLGFLPNLDW